MQIVQISAVDIPDAWFQSIYKILDYGNKYQVQHGSFVGETRLEFDFAVINIALPYNSNYDEMRPKIPAQLSIPDPVEPGYIEQYVPYLMTGHKEPNEDYTYGSRIEDQIDYWINRLSKTPNTNQAVLQVARPEDYQLEDPPCLRHIDMRVQNDRCLHFYPVLRSWELWSGFPANLAAIAILQEYMASSIGVKVGEMVATSKGLHIYGYAENLVEIRCNKPLMEGP